MDNSLKWPYVIIYLSILCKLLYFRHDAYYAMQDDHLTAGAGFASLNLLINESV